MRWLARTLKPQRCCNASLLQLVNESRQLGAVRDALRGGAVDVALRQVDRAWRCEPENAASLAPIYGRLLLLEGSDDEAALNLLRRAAELKPDADTSALIAVALLQLDRPREARRTLEAALGNSCVAPRSLLGHAAGRVMRHPAIAAPGWIGRGPRLEFLGELNDGELDRGELNSAAAASTLGLRLDGETEFSPIGGSSLACRHGGLPFQDSAACVEQVCRGREPRFGAAGQWRAAAALLRPRRSDHRGRRSLERLGRASLGLLPGP